MCSIEHPIKRGLITDWEAMEEIWSHTLESELKVSSKDHPVLLTESACRLMSDREKMTQIMFEKLQSPALYVAMQVVLNLYSEGRTTGTVLDSGYGVTQVVPIYEGNISAKVCTLQELKLQGIKICDGVVLSIFMGLMFREGP